MHKTRVFCNGETVSASQAGQLVTMLPVAVGQVHEIQGRKWTVMKVGLNHLDEPLADLAPLQNSQGEIMADTPAFQLHAVSEMVKQQRDKFETGNDIERAEAYAYLLGMHHVAKLHNLESEVVIAQVANEMQAILHPS